MSYGKANRTSAAHTDATCVTSDTCPCKLVSYNTSIWTACQFNEFILVANKISLQPDLVKALDRIGYSPLHYAAQGNYTDIVRLLLSHGADPDGGAGVASCSSSSSSSSSASSYRISGGKPCGATPLHRAAFSGALECCALLLDAGAHVNSVDTSLSDHRTPLLKAASQGREDVVQFLLERGADPRAVDSQGHNYLSLLQLATTSTTAEAEEISDGAVCSEVSKSSAASYIIDSGSPPSPVGLAPSTPPTTASNPLPLEVCSRCYSPSISFAIIRKQLVCMKCKMKRG